jgi:hypothetical protein
MGLDDYAQALGQAQRLVPNWRQNDFVEAQLAQERLQPQIAQSQIAENQAQARAIDFKQQRQAAFQARLQQLGAKPSPQAYRALGAEFPEFHEAIDGVATGLDGDQSKAMVRQLAPVQALIANKKYDVAAAEVKRHLDADKAAGLPEDEDNRHLYDELTSGDASRQQAAGGIVYGLLASLDPKNAAENLAKNGGIGGVKGQVVGRAIGHYDANGQWQVDYRDPESTEYRTVSNGDGSSSIVAVGGGGPTSVGGAAGPRGDVSRLINSDAGGGQVPASVQTLGQFVSWGRALNRNGARSSSAGTYQINGTTMAEFAPKALGPDWRDAPFTADAQDKVGKAIFDWAKQQPNPAAALKGRWVSLSGSQAAQLVRGDWSQARGTIAAGETGGGPGASAARGNAAQMDGSQVVFTSKPKTADGSNIDPNLVGEPFLAALPAGRRSLLQAIAQGRAKPPQPGSRFGQALAEDLARAFPNTDTTVFATRQQTMNAFARGPEARTTRSLNVAIDHLGVLHDAALALESGNVPLFNKLSQRWQTATGGPLPNNAKAVAGIVADEVVKAVVGSGGALADRQDLKATLDTAGSPAQVKGITRSYISLMAGQANGLRQQYEQGTGNTDFGRFLNPTTRKLLNIPKPGSGSGAQPRRAPPAVGTVRNGYRYKGGNPADRSSWQAVR